MNFLLRAPWGRQALWLGFLAGIAFPVWGAQSKALSLEAEVNKALAPLRKSAGITVALKKKTVNTLLDKEKTSEGRLHYWQGKLRVETESPEESILVMDGKTLWLAQTLPADMGGKVLVSKTQAKTLKKSSTLFAALLGNGKPLKEFKLKDRRETDKKVHLEFVPKNEDESEIQKLDLWINGPDQRLVQITYWDDKENEVTFELGDIEKIKGDKTKLFSYKPPKDAEITEF